MALRLKFFPGAASLCVAVIGFFTGLVAGCLAEILIVPLALLATGHPHPLSILEDSFSSTPPGALALAMMTGYFTTAFFGSIAAYRATRKHASRWNPRVSPALLQAAAILRRIRQRIARSSPAKPILNWLFRK